MEKELPAELDSVEAMESKIDMGRSLARDKRCGPTAQALRKLTLLLAARFECDKPLLAVRVGRAHLNCGDFNLGETRVAKALNPRQSGGSETADKVLKPASFRLRRPQLLDGALHCRASLASVGSMLLTTIRDDLLAGLVKFSGACFKRRADTRPFRHRAPCSGLKLASVATLSKQGTLLGLNSFENADEAAVEQRRAKHLIDCCCIQLGLLAECLHV